MVGAGTLAARKPRASFGEVDPVVLSRHSAWRSGAFTGCDPGLTLGLETIQGIERVAGRHRIRIEGIERLPKRIGRRFRRLRSSRDREKRQVVDEGPLRHFAVRSLELAQDSSCAL